jgi:hypothetical protein
VHQDAVVRQGKSVHFVANRKIPSVIIVVENAAPIDAAVIAAVTKDVVTSAVITDAVARYTITN